MNLGWLHLVGLALNVIGAGLLFVFAYPPKDGARLKLYLGVARSRWCSCSLAFCCSFSPTSRFG